MTLHAVTIRPARAGEEAAISALAVASKAHWGYSAEFMEACRGELRVTASQLADPSRHTYVATVVEEEADATLAGYYALAPLPDADEALLDLDAMFVDPRFIGQGVGGRLLTHAKARASELGALALMIQSDPNAAAFYCAAGAVEVSVRESGSIPGRFLPELRLALRVARCGRGKQPPFSGSM